MTDGKVTFFLHDLRGGGVERISVNLINNIAQRGRPVELILVADRGHFRGGVASSVIVRTLSEARMSHSIFALARQIDTSRPAVIVSAMTHANVVCLLACRFARHKPRIIVVEHNQFSKNIRLKKQTRSMLAYLLAPIIYGWADCVGAVSQGVKEDLVRSLRLPEAHVRVLYNPVVNASLLKVEGEAVPHPWLGPSGPPVVLGVGRLQEQKNFPLLIGAFARVRSRRPLKLMILGTGPLEGQLRDAAAATGFGDDIMFAGFVEPFAYMRHASLFVLSSDWEGLPTALLEAMGCGLPVVATDCPSGPREILRNGELGRLVGVGAEGELAGAIADTLDRPKDGADLRNRAADFSFESAGDQYIELIDELLAS